ncbi:MAG: iron ABC transporter permease [Acidimicrobiia bacterium]|nr:iron ABC transporter permease [Acidimicrobiia bacterium]
MTTDHLYDPFAVKRRWYWVTAGAALVATLLASLAIGAVDVSIGGVVDSFLSRIGIRTEPATDPIVWEIRFPRAMTALVVGAALGLVGAVLQGLLRNDLADPHLLGLGPGAAIGAAIGTATAGIQAGIAGGVFAGVAASFLLRRLARRISVDPTRIILSGVALGLVLNAWVGFVVFGLDRSSVPPLEFWLLGSLSGSSWRSFGTVAVFLSLAAAGLFLATRSLDLMAFGDSEARHLGVDTDMVTTMVMIASGAAVGATVGAAGVIAFVGLLVPFIARSLVGHEHKHLLPASMIGGAIFVAASDLAARTLIEPVELPVGLITAAVGGPVFLWLLGRRRDV